MGIVFYPFFQLRLLQSRDLETTLPVDLALSAFAESPDLAISKADTILSHQTLNLEVSESGGRY